MPNTTKGWPYPDGSAKMGQYPNKIQDLAQKLDDRILLGVVTINIAIGNAFGTGTVPTAPLSGGKLKVVALTETTSGYTCSLPAAPVPTTDTQLRAHRPAGASTAAPVSVPCHYIAIATD